MPKNSTPEKDEFDPASYLISLCGVTRRVFSCYMNSPYRRAEELSPLLAEFVKAGAIAFLASGWGLGLHTRQPYNPTWSDADGGVFHSIYVFSFPFVWYFPRVCVTLPQKLGLTNYSPL